MVNLTDLQAEFLKKEFGLSVGQIESMDTSAWKKVRENCYDIVLDEMLDENDEYRPEGDGSERCSIASAIMDLTFSRLHG